MKRITVLTVAAAILALAFATKAVAQSSVPNLINFQGKLTDNSGNPVADGPHSLTFRIFDSEVSGPLGPPLWTEGPVSLTTSGGLFNHRLGLSVALPQNLFKDNDSLFLEIEAEDGTIFTPRTHLISNPYSRMTAVIAADAVGSVEIATDAVGTSEVANGSLLAADLADEPGVASNTYVAADIDLTGPVQTLLSRIITVPASGYVLVIGTCGVTISHTMGTASNANFGVSNVAGSFPANQDLILSISPNLPTGTFYKSVTRHGLFPVGAGSTIFYLLGDEVSSSFSVEKIQLTLVYLPTTYGTVVPTTAESGENIFEDKAAGQPRMTTADAAGQPEKFNAERITRELAQVKAEMEALKKELREQRNQSQQVIENENEI